MGFFDSITKIFGGNKYDRDIKAMQPIVDEINAHFEEYRDLSNDRLRGKTIEFQSRIKEHLSEIDKEMQDLRLSFAENPQMDVDEKEEIYEAVDKLQKEKDKEIEVILEEILPEAFAAVKETARRFKDNTSLEATANELDRDLSVDAEHITVNLSLIHI